MALVTIVEDEPAIRDALSRALQQLGHEVRSQPTGLTGLSEIVAHPPGVVVLDLGLPDIDGLELLRMLRAVSDVPVIVATARDQEAEIVSTLHAGADDYLVKPFSADQLDARIRAVLRRAGETTTTPVTIGSLVIDGPARQARLDGRDLELTRKEFDLLDYLARHRDRVVSKRELLAAIWDQPWGGSDKTVDVHLSWLRRKLGETAAAPRFLRTVRGVGVRLVEPAG